MKRNTHMLIVMSVFILISPFTLLFCVDDKSVASSSSTQYGLKGLAAGAAAGGILGLLMGGVGGAQTCSLMHRAGLSSTGPTGSKIIGGAMGGAMGCITYSLFFGIVGYLVGLIAGRIKEASAKKSETSIIKPGLTQETGFTRKTE